MWRILLGFIVGVTAAPLVRERMKPFLREVVKKSIIAGVQLQKLTAEAKEDLEDLAAEAAAEVDAGEHRPH